MRTAALEDRRVREKFSCRDCEAITEPPAPARPIPRGLAGPSLLAMVLAAVYTVIETCKFTDVDPHAWLADVLARLPGLPLFFALARPAPVTHDGPFRTQRRNALRLLRPTACRKKLHNRDELDTRRGRTPDREVGR
jgi:transposase